MLTLLMLANCTQIGLTKEKKDDTSALGLLAIGVAYVNDQNSGHCALVTKKGTSYEVVLVPVNKSECKVDTTRESAVASLKTSYQKQIDIYTKVGATCDVSKANRQSQLNSVTVTSQLSVGNITSKVYATEDEYAIAIANVKTYNVGNMVMESSATLTNAGFDVTKTSAASSDQYYLSLAANNASYSNPNCDTAIKALDPTYFSEKNKTKVEFSNCKYGTGANSTNQCNTLKEEF